MIEQTEIKTSLSITTIFLACLCFGECMAQVCLRIVGITGAMEGGFHILRRNEWMRSKRLCRRRERSDVSFRTRQAPETAPTSQPPAPPNPMLRPNFSPAHHQFHRHHHSFTLQSLEPSTPTDSKCRPTTSSSSEVCFPPPTVPASVCPSKS